jgi:hypothetical protein
MFSSLQKNSSQQGAAMLEKGLERHNILPQDDESATYFTGKPEYGMGC